MSNGFSRRDALKIVGGAVVGLALGVGTGYIMGSSTVPATRTITQTLERTVTQTATATRAETPKPSPGTVPSGPIKIGVFAFLTGAGAVGGVHIRNAAEIILDWINNREGGILGRKIEMTFVDEAIGTADLVKAARRMVTEDKVELIAGLQSSSNGLALAPVAEEELHTVTIFNSSTTTRLFEEVDPKPFYVFRCANYDPMETVAGAKLALKLWPNIKRVAGINQDYAFGRDSWAIFTAALKKLKPDIEIVHESWFPLGTPDFTSHIAAIDAARPDLVMTSMWGGDLVTFAKQAEAAGLFRKYRFVLTNGYSTYPDLDKAWTPEGLLCGSRTYWPFYPPNWPLGQMFLKEYVSRFRTYPVYETVHLFMSIYAYKLAVEKAYSALGRYPSQEDIVKFLEGIYVAIPSGYRFFRREDHQGLGYAVYGITKHDPNYRFPILDPVYIFPPEEVAPPPRMRWSDWIASW